MSNSSNLAWWLCNCRGCGTKTVKCSVIAAAVQPNKPSLAYLTCSHCSLLQALKLLLGTRRERGGGRGGEGERGRQTVQLKRRLAYFGQVLWGVDVHIVCTPSCRVQSCKLIMQNGHEMSTLYIKQTITLCVVTAPRLRVASAICYQVSLDC